MFVELCMCSIIYIIMNFEYKKLVFNVFILKNILRFVCNVIIYCILSIIMLIKLNKIILRKCI